MQADLLSSWRCQFNSTLDSFLYVCKVEKDSSFPVKVYVCSGLVLVWDDGKMPKKIVLCYIILMELWLDKHLNIREGANAQALAVGGRNVAAESHGIISEYVFKFSEAS